MYQYSSHTFTNTHTYAYKGGQWTYSRGCSLLLLLWDLSCLPFVLRARFARELYTTAYIGVHDKQPGRDSTVRLHYAALDVCHPVSANVIIRRGTIKTIERIIRYFRRSHMENALSNKFNHHNFPQAEVHNA